MYVFYVKLQMKLKLFGTSSCATDPENYIIAYLN